MTEKRASTGIVLAAVSGGADSMALLDMLIRAGVNVCCAHFNHGIRGKDSDGDELFVKNWCRDRGIPCITQKADVPHLAKEKGLTLEQAAREARYAFLYKSADESGADTIALAHHMDDQAETLLLNLVRGAGLDGLCGMKEKSGRLWRPLLDMRKADILEYCEKNGIPYRTDATNFDVEYSRNRIRALIKELEIINPACVNNIARTAKLLQTDAGTLNAIAGVAFEAAKSGDSIDAKKTLEQPEAIRTRMVRRLAKDAGLEADFEQKHARALLAMAENCKSGARLALTHGYEARLDYGGLSIKKARAEQAGFELPLAPGVYRLRGGRLIITLEKRPEKLGADWPKTCELSPEALKGAVIRSRRDGDRLLLAGGGSKKLKDVFSDKKLPREKRCMPLIAKGNEILLAPGIAMSRSARVNNNEAEIIRVTWEDAGDE